MLVDSESDFRPDRRHPFTVLIAGGWMFCLLLLATLSWAAESEEREAAAGSDAKIAGEEAPEEGVVSGVLVDAADGKPVAGAQVLLRSGGRVMTTSDEAGRFRFENVHGYKHGYTLWAHRGNLVTEKVPVFEIPSEGRRAVTFKPLRLEMKPGKQARFIVRSRETRQPIAEAAIRFGYPDRRNVPTDRDGVATVEGLLSEKYDVIVEAVGYARHPQQIDLREAQAVTENEVALVPGGEVRGVVLDEEGKPVADAAVAYWQAGGSGYHGDSFRTDAEGRFRHRFLPLDVPLEVSIDKKGSVNAKEDISLTTDIRSRDVRITLRARPRGGSIAGVVLDESGNPIADAKVVNDGVGPEERLTVTNGQGMFVLQDLTEGFAGVDVRVSAKGFAPQRVPVKPGTFEKPANITVTLKPGATIRGRVVSEAGEPVAGVYVMARSPVFRMGMESVRTDDQGEFALDSLPDDVHFDFGHPQYASTQSTALPLNGAEPVKVVLEDPGLVRGRVIDAATKRPVPQFRIRVGFSNEARPGDARGSYDSSWSKPGLTFRSDEGEFKIQPVKAGMPLELTIESEGYERHLVRRAVAAKSKDAQDLTVSIKPKVHVEPASLTVQLLDHEARPISGAHLRLIVSPERSTGKDDNKFNWALIESGQLGQKSYVEQYLPGVTDGDGKCEFKNVAPDMHLQLVYWGDAVPKGRWLEFAKTRPGKSETEVIKMPAAAVVRGTVDRSIFPDAGAIRLSIATEAFLSFQTKLAPDQSAFELKNLPPGNYWISVDGRPQIFSENGHQMSRIAPLVSRRLLLEPGDEKELNFDKLEPPR